MVVSRSLFTIILSTGLPVAIERKGKENIKRGGGEEEAALPIRVKMHSCLLSERRTLFHEREREREEDTGARFVERIPKLPLGSRALREEWPFSLLVPANERGYYRVRIKSETALPPPLS